MAFTSFSAAALAVGKSLKKELWDLVKSNFDDHESRILSVEVASSLITIFDETVYNGSSNAASFTNLLLYKATVPITITRVQLQIFEKGAITSGLLTLDCKKSSTLNQAGFATILTTQASIDFATDPDFTEDNAVINGALNDLAVDDFLKVDITGLPSAAIPLSQFRIVVYGDISV